MPVFDATVSAPAASTPHSGPLKTAFCKQDARETFRALLHSLPVSLAVRGILRTRVLAERGSPRAPLLDVGCGDGLFWEVLTRDLATPRLPSLGDESTSRGMAGCARARQARGRLPHGDRELLARPHVPKLADAPSNIRRYMAPDGEQRLFVPAPRWSDTFVVKRLLRKLGNGAAST